MLTARVLFMLELDVEQLRLVLKALGGRLKDSDVQLAKELGDRLTKLRAQSTKAQVENANRLLSQLDG